MTRVIGVVSGKGGVGKTTLVANLALSLKEFGERVAAVDCNITTPHLSFYLGAYSYPLSLNDVLRGDAVITSAAYYHNGIIIVPASQKTDDLIDVDMSNLKDDLNALKNLTDVILLDSAPSLGKEALSVLRASDEIIFVTNPLMLAVNDVLKCCEVIKRLDLKIIGIVLNMVRNDKYELTEDQIERITGLPVIARIPFDKDILAGLSKKTPIVQYKPNSAASLVCARLASNLLGIPSEPSKSIFSSFYNAFKKLTSFRETSGIEIQTYSSDIRTDADRILDIVNAERSIKLSELAKKLNLSKEETKTLGKTLEEHGLIEFYSPMFGETRLRVKE